MFFIHFYFKKAFIYTLHKMFVSESFKLLINSMLHKSCNCHDLERIFQGTRFFYINQTQLLLSWFMESGFSCDKL